MNASYSGNARPFVVTLFAPSDRERVMPLLEQLDQRGYALCGQDGKATAAQAKRACAVVAFLSAAFAASDDQQAVLLAADAAGVPIVPVQLDEAEQPELVRRALMATNAIMAQRYETPEALVDRLCSAEALATPQVTAAQKAAAKRTTTLLVAAAACVLVLVGVLLVRTMSGSAKSGAAKKAAEQYGLTEEDLAEIRDVVIVGEHFVWTTSATLDQWQSDGYPTHWDYTSNYEDDDGTRHWVWNEDGSETQRSSYDLSFLTLMPNLRKLSLVNADLTVVPSLEGLEHLDTVMLYNDTLPEDGLSFLEGSTVVTMDIASCGVSDYTPLNACQQLADLILDATPGEELDISGFAPSGLKRLAVEQVANGLDSLSGCAQLEDLAIRYSDYADVDFLEGHTTLKTLDLDVCEALTDASALASCTNLEELRLQDAFELRDLGFLDSLSRLRSLELFGVPVRDFSFIGKAGMSDGLSLGFALSGDGEVDFSGLATIKRWDRLHVNPSGRGYASVYPYIKDASIKELELHDCDGVDLSQLPQVTYQLRITGGDLTSLRGLDQPKVNALLLYNMQYLTSLAGVEGAPNALTGDNVDANKLEIAGCFRLSDWSALEGKKLNRLELKHLYELPDFATVETNQLRIESIDDLTDLSCLDALPTTAMESLELIGLDQVQSLAPVAHLRSIGHLSVPPQLADQAEALQKEGIVHDWEVAYPDGGWDDQGGMRLFSLDELDTLPPALLAKVDQLMLVGDEVIDSGWIDLDESGDATTFTAYDHDHNRTFEVSRGTMTDLTRLAPLTGLKELKLCLQSMTTLNGLEQLQNLEMLSINWTHEMEDVSAAFALPKLRELFVDGVGVRSLEGVQNLTDLEEVSVAWNEELKDLSPLLELPNLRSVKVSSNMEEALASIEGKDYGFELEVVQAD